MYTILQVGRNLYGLDMKIEGWNRVPHNRSPPLGSPQPPPLSQVITLAHDDDHRYISDDDYDFDYNRLLS